MVGTRGGSFTLVAVNIDTHANIMTWIAALVALAGVSELSGITASADGGLKIGAMTTISEIAEHQTIGASFTALADAGREEDDSARGGPRPRP